MKSTPSQTFRAGVGAVIRNSKGEVLAFERRDKPECWQLPQGGMESGESPTDAVFREIYEETKIERDKLQRISKTTPLLAYELPPEHRSGKTGRGQAIYWFVFNLTGADDDIDLTGSEEFKDKKWTTMDGLIEEVVDFRKPVYQELKRQFSHLL